MIAQALDAILGLVVIEAIGLVVLNQTTGHGLAPKKILGMLAAGFFLMLATRLALGGAGDAPIAACLFASLLAHLADLAIRWREARAP